MPQGWEDIRAEVLARIRSRLWLPGSLIPGEEALAQEFSCARATVNRALQDLAEAGVLERKRRAGTRVASLPVRKARLDIPILRAEIEGRGQAYSFHLLDMAKALPPPAIAARLGLAGPLLHLRTLHLADGRPQVYEDRWLNPAVLPDPEPDFALIGANEWLVSNLPFLHGDIAFSAEAATEAEAQALNVATGSALFITERATFGPDYPITWVRLAHAPGYRLRTHL